MEYRIDHHNQFNEMYTREEVQELINNGSIDSHTKVWTADWNAWKKIEDADFDLSSADDGGQGISEHLFLSMNGYLRALDNGGLFQTLLHWVYGIFAGLNLFFPVYLLYLMIDGDILDAKGKYVFLALIIWLVTAFAGWVSFQIWWGRRSKIQQGAIDGKGFPASTIFSNFIQTVGEWAGTWIAIIGFFLSLLANLFDDEMYSLNRAFDFLFMGEGVVSILLYPIYGFLLIISTRFLAEQIRAISIIANGVKSIKKKIN